MAWQKKQKCDCGNDTQEKTFDKEFNLVWECTNCHKQSPAKKQSPMKKNAMFEGVEVTSQQKKTLEKLKADILEKDGGPEYEYKKFEIQPFQSDSTICLLAEVGRKDDEGTERAITERIKRYIFIGERGNVELANPQQDEIVTGYKNVISTKTKES